MTDAATNLRSVTGTDRRVTGVAPEAPPDERLEFREIDHSPDSLAALARFYRDRYVVEFPDPDERESLANMRRYLALKAQGWYGPNNYHILVAERGGEPVGGAVFDYLAAPNAGVIEFLFVAAAHRIAGIGRALLDEAIRILRVDALQRGGRRLAAVVAEMNDPFRRPATPDNLDPFCRAAIWGKWGFGVVEFPYVQPALSAGQASVDGLVLIARIFRAAPKSGISAAWVKLVVAEYLRWAMRIADPATSADYCAMADFLDRRSRVALRPLPQYIGDDPQREFEVEEIFADDEANGAGENGAGDERNVLRGNGAPGCADHGGRSAELAGTPARDDRGRPPAPSMASAFRAAVALAHAAIPFPGRVASPREFAAALAARRAGGPAYHLWALRAPGADAIEGMASFFSLPSAGFGGYLVLTGSLRGRGLLPLLVARIETRMIRDGTKAEGWFVECGQESVAAFVRVGFAEVPLDYRPPPVGESLPASRPPEPLHLLYKRFGPLRSPPVLEPAFVLRALREILRDVYGIAAPHRHPCYRVARRSLSGASTGSVLRHPD